MTQPKLNNNTSQHRYELQVDGKTVGFAQYEAASDAIVFLHTEIDPSEEGKGYGSKLAKNALDDVRAQGKRIVPRCEFIAAYLKKHPEYEEWVDRPAKA